MTLVLSPDSGSPTDVPKLGSLATPDVVLDPKDYEVYHTLMPIDCTGSQPVDWACRVKVEVLSHFVNAQNSQGIPNQKSTQVGGMTARSTTMVGDIDVPGVKLLTSWLSSALSEQFPSLPFLGGAEFDHSVVGKNTQREEGCGPGFHYCDTPEDAAYNVLNKFFNCTKFGPQFGADCTDPVLMGSARVRIQYVDVEYDDIKYAIDPDNSCPSRAFKSSAADPWNTCTSLHDLLNWARYDLLTTGGEKPTSKPAPTCTEQLSECR